MLTDRFLSSVTKLASLTKQVKDGGHPAGGHKAHACAASWAIHYLNDVGGIRGDLLRFGNHVLDHQVELGGHAPKGLQAVHGRPPHLLYGAPQVKEKGCHY